jgi:hypothetical protein
MSDGKYLTKDLHLAGYIYYKGIPLLDVETDASKKFAWFVFEKQKESRVLEKEYWDKKGIVEITSYLQAVNFLKQRIYQTSQFPNKKSQRAYR